MLLINEYIHGLLLLMIMKRTSTNKMERGKIISPSDKQEIKQSNRINMFQILFLICFLCGTFPYRYNPHSQKYIFCKRGMILVVVALCMSPTVMFTTFTKSLLYTSKSVLEPWFFYGGTLIQLNIVTSRIFKIKKHFYLCSQVHKLYLEHEQDIPAHWFLPG